MASRRRQRRKCTQKIAYPSEYDANVAARRLWRQGKYLRVYKCEFGDHWHLGHPKSLWIEHAEKMKK